MKPQQLIIEMWLHLSGVKFGYALYWVWVLLEKYNLDIWSKYFYFYLRILQENLVKKALRNGNPRITEWLRLEGTSEGHLVQPSSSSRVT